MHASNAQTFTCIRKCVGQKNLCLAAEKCDASLGAVVLTPLLSSCCHHQRPSGARRVTEAGLTAHGGLS